MPSWLCCCPEHPQHVLCLRRPCWPPDRKTTIPFFNNLTASDSARLQASTHRPCPKKLSGFGIPLGASWDEASSRGAPATAAIPGLGTWQGTAAAHSWHLSLLQGTAHQPVPAHLSSSREQRVFLQSKGKKSLNFLSDFKGRKAQEIIEINRGFG